MIYFTGFEILKSVIAAVVLGLIFGCFFAATENTLMSLKLLLKLPLDSYALSKDFSLCKEKLNATRHLPNLSKITRNIFEFCFFLAFGITFIIALYLFLDGIPRLYFVAICVFCFFIGKRMLGKLFCRLYDSLFTLLYFSLLLTLSVFLIPLTYLYSFTKKLIKTITSPIVRHYEKLHSNHLINKKIKEISKIKC